MFLTNPFIQYPDVSSVTTLIINEPLLIKKHYCQYEKDLNSDVYCLGFNLRNGYFGFALSLGVIAVCQLIGISYGIIICST